MPMVIEPRLHALTRRAALQRLGLSAITLLSAGAAAARPQGAGSATERFAACWDSPDGTHHVGWLKVDATGQLTVLHPLELPTRGHGLALLPDGSLLVAARRPGDWLIRLPTGRPAQWLWQASDRVFCGHVSVSADGLSIYTTEVDTTSGQGLLAVRDAQTLQLRTEYKTFGLDPHAVLARPAIHSRANFCPPRIPS